MPYSYSPTVCIQYPIALNKFISVAPATNAFLGTITGFTGDFYLNLPTAVHAKKRLTDYNNILTANTPPA